MKNAMIKTIKMVTAAVLCEEQKPTTSVKKRTITRVSARDEKTTEMTVTATVMMRNIKSYERYEEMEKLAAWNEMMITMMMEMDEVVYVQQRADTPAQETQVSAFYPVETVMLTREKIEMMGMMKMAMDEAAVEPLRPDINAVGNPVHVLSNVAMKNQIQEKIEMMVI